MCPGHIDFGDGHSRAAYCAHLSLEVIRGRARSQSVTLACATEDSSETEMDEEEMTPSAWLSRAWCPAAAVSV